VERNLISGTIKQLEGVLFNSEDSSIINISFVERHNLTIRQGSAYLTRRTASHCRQEKYLEGHIQLLKCYYNIIRQHQSLRWGNEVRTLAMQAGLVSRKLSFRDVFLCRVIFLFCVFMVVLMMRDQVGKRAQYCPSATVAWWGTGSFDGAVQDDGSLSMNTGISDLDADPNGTIADENFEDVGFVCTPGMDQTCNDSPIISSLHGTCNSDGTCTCDRGWEKNPLTGRCLWSPKGPDI